jgi:general secretion pathway protein M
MMPEHTITRYLARSPRVASLLYVVIVGSLLVTTGLTVSDILDRRRALAQTSEMLDQIKGRKGGGPAAGVMGAAPAGTPFLEGPTVTVAGAALLQRVADAIGNAGGTVQSSQVDLQGVLARDGFVGLLVSCEMDQPALQKVLYDLEAGMPFLFVDQLDVQSPQTTAVGEGGAGRVRVVLGVSGQWQAGK